MSFLREPPTSAARAQRYQEDLDEDGFVWDATRLWSHQPDLWDQLAELFGRAADAAGLAPRDKAMLVLGTASTLGDSYCSMAWGRFLTEWADADTARAVLAGDDAPLTDRERALAAWARRIAADPNATTAEDVQALRDAGFDDAGILALTTYAALRLALSTTNDALGARPDAALADMLEPPVRSAITWGRRPA
jgi:alkylhydroperoxidase family enzyme